MITTGTRSMIPSLKSLWIEVFGDSEEYVEFFFKNRFDNITTFVYLVHDMPVSMAFVFDEELCIEDKQKDGVYVKAGYIYGVATLVEHRGKGYSTHILKHIHDIYPTTFLIPATKSLFDFYRRNGYKTAFYINEIQLHHDEIELSDIQYSFEPISSKEYKAIRDKHFQKDGYIRWTDVSITYSIEENKVWGGQALKVNEGIILYRCHHNQLYIKETTLAGQELYDVAALLMRENNASKCHIRLTPDTCSNKQGFGMLHSSYQVADGYCNLVLD
jgi:GNAT superfamily N-acetyltransferase